MENYLINALLATFAISLLSLTGSVVFLFKHKTINKLTLFLVAFSTGALVGGAFLHLLPESIEESSNIMWPFLYLLVGISVFFVLERFLKWHHCHKDSGCEVHTFTYMSLVGDGLHNFIDGLIIVSSFAISPEIGTATTIAVAAHELPQELGDFAVLLHGGFSKTKALFWNFIVSIVAIAGVVLGYVLISHFHELTSVLLPFAAGGFVYIAMSDLIPELHKEVKLSKSVLNFVLFIFGIGFMLLIKLFFS